MFSTVNHFQMFKAGSVNGRRSALRIQTGEQIKSIRITSNFTKQPRVGMAEENMQNNKMNII